MILVTGATGFVGRHLVRRMRSEGLPVRALVRTAKKAQALREQGVEIAEGDIGDKESLENAAHGVERIIHLVGIIQETHRSTFQAIHVDGTRNLLEAAKKQRIRHFFYQSALGSRPDAQSEYHKTKWQAEELVRASEIPWTILRPSLIYGPGDLFTIRLAEIIKRSPVLPVIGSGKSKVQPISVHDAVSCIIMAITNERYLNGIYEVGGPEQLSYKTLTHIIAETLGIKRPPLHVPIFLMNRIAGIAETLLSKPPVTRDQLTMLQEDNVCKRNDIKHSFGIDPISFRTGVQQALKGF